MFKKIVFGCFFLCCLGLGALCYLLEKEWVNFSQLGYYSQAKPSIVLDNEGRELARFELDRRDPVTYDKIPDIIVKAFIAAEDHRFFEHPGISFKGIIRSFLVNFYHGRVVQGASTITQQLARGMFLYHNRTMWRKIQEVFIAFQLERQLSKEQILELYLNNIYFGQGTYGVEAACRRFWNISLSEVTTAQAATLAAVPASAFLYSPLNAPCSAKKRRNVIITTMQRLGFIGEREALKAKDEKLVVLDSAQGNPIRLYIIEWVRVWAESLWGREALYRQGLRIQTTINSDIQTAAEKSFNAVVAKMNKEMEGNFNGGLISLDTATGKIRAAVGGLNFKASQFNRTFQAYRQMGSAFKPLLFAYALERGVELDQVMIDEPFELELANGQTWAPRNWHRRFEGPMTLVRALTVSNNVISVKLFLDLGIPEVVSWMRRFNFKNELPAYPSAALGTIEATLEETSAAFNSIVNGGVLIKPYLVEWVKDCWGKKLWMAEPKSTRVMSRTTASKMINALSHRMELNKKRTKDGWIDAQSIGKTGSTNGAATTWFVGATPSFTTAVYVGRDDNKPMGSRVYASATAYPIWLEFNKAILHPKKEFYIDPSLHSVTIDWITGQSGNYTSVFGHGDVLQKVAILKD